MRRAVWALLVAVTIGVLPGRTWLSQSRAMDASEHRQTVLSQENAALQQRIAQLQQPSYIEQLARSEFGLVMPGEQAYALLPPTTTVAPAAHG
jgi:cell division protein FtsB